MHFTMRIICVYSVNMCKQCFTCNVSGTMTPQPRLVLKATPRWHRVPMLSRRFGIVFLRRHGQLKRSFFGCMLHQPQMKFTVIFGCGRSLGECHGVGYQSIFIIYSVSLCNYVSLISQCAPHAKVTISVFGAETT